MTMNDDDNDHCHKICPTLNWALPVPTENGSWCSCDQHA